MVIKKRQILWDWTNTAGPGNPGIPDKINQVPFGDKSPVASVVNWNAWVPPELKGRAPFHPMVRVLDSTKGSDWAIIQESKFPIILFFNEPERAGISPELAKDIWYKQMLPLRRNKGKKLGSPAVASDENGRKWIEKFMQLVASDPPDILCLHYYSKDANEAIQYIENMHKKWPSRKVMVTEIACIDRNYQAVLNFTVKMCNWMDGQAWISEYGLFDFQRKVADGFVSPAAQLMDVHGNFTELGKMYVNQQPMKLPGKAAELANATVAVAAAGPGHNDAKPEAPEEGGGAVETAGGVETDGAIETGGPVSHESNDTVFHSAGDETATAHGEVKIMAELNIAAALGQDQQAALNAHNNGRKAKGLKPLVWDQGLAKNAEAYARHLAKIGKLQHSSGDQRPNQGENLAWSSSAGATPLTMGAKLWMAEEKNYHGEPIGQGNFGSYGHYTQCMWKSTTKLGMGWAKDAKGGAYVVGRYSPPGNITGQRPF